MAVPVTNYKYCVVHSIGNTGCVNSWTMYVYICYAPADKLKFVLFSLTITTRRANERDGRCVSFSSNGSVYQCHVRSFGVNRYY